MASDAFWSPFSILAAIQHFHEQRQAIDEALEHTLTFFHHQITRIEKWKNRSISKGWSFLTTRDSLTRIIPSFTTFRASPRLFRILCPCGSLAYWREIVCRNLTITIWQEMCSSYDCLFCFNKWHFAIRTKHFQTPRADQLN